MEQNKTQLIFILDRSGSMSGLESDTIGGFNSVIKKQKKQSGKATVTTVLFDNQYELLHDGVSLDSVQPITTKEYYVRGTTALLDAVGSTISKVRSTGKKADKVLMVIITDGLENASREYSLEKVKTLIQKAKKKHNWEFIFLGANMDAVNVAGSYGISAETAVNYHADERGTQITYAAVSEAVSELRRSNKLSAKWRESADDDFAERT